MRPVATVRVFQALRTVSEEALMRFAAVHNVPCRRWQTLEQCSPAEVLERSRCSDGSEAATTGRMMPLSSWMAVEMACRSVGDARCWVVWYESAASCSLLPLRLQCAVAAATVTFNQSQTILSSLGSHLELLRWFAECSSQWWRSVARWVLPWCGSPLGGSMLHLVSATATSPPSQ